MYVDKILPFLADSDLGRVRDEQVPIGEIFCPLESIRNAAVATSAPMEDWRKPPRRLKAYRVRPLDILVLAEPDSISTLTKTGHFGKTVECSVTEVDYSSLAQRIDIVDGQASVKIFDAYQVVDGVVSSDLITLAANGLPADGPSLNEIIVPETRQTMGLRDLVNVTAAVTEDTDINAFLQKNEKKKGEIGDASSADLVYRWLDNYFRVPEETADSAREVVPLLVGPTGVFKSATVKELCDKYNYRLVDFRVTFTSRLDYSGLFNMGEIDGSRYSYSCPMEELVTCSDGFREFCRRAYAKVSEILKQGYIVTSKTSDGENVNETHQDLSAEQRETLVNLLEQYKNYMRTPVLFFDEITRCKDEGVEGILVTLLNQKKFQNMTMYGCKFVAATNLNLMTGNSRHDDLMPSLDEMYDVSQDIDVAFSNRFIPLKVLPDDVAGRWYSWAEGTKEKHGKVKQNIHPVVLEFLRSRDGYDKDGRSLLYNETPILDAIENEVSEEEQKSQTFPNYRTWEMISDYLYGIEDTKKYNRNTVTGLISEWAGDKLLSFLSNKGYSPEQVDTSGDDLGHFLESTLDSGVPAMMIGPSSIGKSSRIKQYCKKLEKQTGKEPIVIDINLASMDTTDIMGMPTKQSITNYVTNTDLRSSNLGALGSELKDLVKGTMADHPEMGMTDTLTVRAPDMTRKMLFKKALEEGRYVILFFDECNRVKNTTIMSAMFQAISDQSIFGISFKGQKDHVKIVAACNMSHEHMGEDLEGMAGDYSHAGSIDPALAARFAVYWKKNYDTNDVKSFIAYLEDNIKEGKIDGTLCSYFKSMDPGDAVRIMAKVEQRNLENAEPSSRMMFQLSKDIKSMRGSKGAKGFQKAMFNGRTLFNDIMLSKVSNALFKGVGNESSQQIQTLVTLSESIISQKSSWEPYITDEKIRVNGEEYSMSEVVNMMGQFCVEIKKRLTQSSSSTDMTELRKYGFALSTLLDVCRTVDMRIQAERRESFEIYLGEEFARDFTPYFNETFGTANDVEITIPMLDDESLIDPFLSKFYTSIANLDTDKMVDRAMKLVQDFWEVHGGTLPPKNYSTLMFGIKGILPSTDSMNELLNRSSEPQDKVLAMAEKTGDSFILAMLAAYPGVFTQKEIDEVRSQQKSGSITTKKRPRVL